MRRWMCVVACLLAGCAMQPVEEPEPESAPELAPQPAAAPTPLRGPRPRITVLPARGAGCDDILLARVEEQFIDNGYDVLDATQLAVIKERDALLFADDPETLAFLRSQGAELVVECSSAGASVGRVLRTDTGEVLFRRAQSGRRAQQNLAAELVEGVDSLGSW